MSPGEAGSPPGPARGEGEAQGWAWGGAACQGSGSVRSAFGFADIMVHTLPAASWVTASVCPCLWHLGGLSRGDPQKRLGAGRPVPSVIENEGRVCRGVCGQRDAARGPQCACVHTGVLPKARCGRQSRLIVETHLPSGSCFIPSLTLTETRVWRSGSVVAAQG